MDAIQTEKAPAAVGPYSQAVTSGGMVYCAGQIPLDPATGELVSGEIADEVGQVLRNLQAVLEAAGTGLDKVVRTTIYVTDLSLFGAVNEAYGSYFEAPYPARVTVGVAALPKGARVEIDAVAEL